VPTIADRKQIFEVHLKGLTLEGVITDYSSRLAALTPGFTGADIANICNEAAITAARRNKKKIDHADFESATDRIIGGMESKKLMSPHEKKIVGVYTHGVQYFQFLELGFLKNLLPLLDYFVLIPDIAPPFCCCVC
jgi:AFG3 family protein